MNELKSIWKEAAVAKIAVLSWYLPKELSKIMKNLSQNSWYPGRIQT
jgi:hypothetical protein